MPKKVEIELRRRRAEERIKRRKLGERRKLIFLTGLLLGFVSISITLFLNKTIGLAGVSFFIVTGIFFLYFNLKGRLSASIKITKMEDSFPDFLQLMASNLRAGMTIDRAMLLSARPEFDPLDKEILSLGKDIATGKSIRNALLDMSQRTKSERIEKTILLILSGIQAGGNIAVLLEETASNMRERGFVEKKAASNVLMYLIFIFVATAVGAPVLFSLSSVLVETVTGILETLPVVEASDMAVQAPMMFSRVNISVSFVIYFSLAFIVVTNVLSSRILGLVSKGDESQGLKYLPFMLALSIGIFFMVRVLLSGVISSMFI